MSNLFEPPKSSNKRSWLQAKLGERLKEDKSRFIACKSGLFQTLAFDPTRICLLAPNFNTQVIELFIRA
jgi:hypothetical protein